MVRNESYESNELRVNLSMKDRYELSDELKRIKSPPLPRLPTLIRSKFVVNSFPCSLINSFNSSGRSPKNSHFRQLDGNDWLAYRVATECIRFFTFAAPVSLRSRFNRSNPRTDCAFALGAWGGDLFFPHPLGTFAPSE
jgi:hypothetical protein